MDTLQKQYSNINIILQSILSLYELSVKNKDIFDCYLMNIISTKEKEPTLVFDYRINLKDGFYTSLIIYFPKNFPSSTAFTYYNKENMFKINHHSSNIFKHFSTRNITYDRASGKLVYYKNINKDNLYVFIDLVKECFMKNYDLLVKDYFDNLEKDNNNQPQNEKYSINKYNSIEETNILKTFNLDTNEIIEIKEFLSLLEMENKNSDYKEKINLNKLSKEPYDANELKAYFNINTTAEKLFNNKFDGNDNSIGLNDIRNLISCDLKYQIYQRLKNKINEANTGQRDIKNIENKIITEIQLLKNLNNKNTEGLKLLSNQINSTKNIYDKISKINKKIQENIILKEKQVNQDDLIKKLFQINQASYYNEDSHDIHNIAHKELVNNKQDDYITNSFNIPNIQKSLMDTRNYNKNNNISTNDTEHSKNTSIENNFSNHFDFYQNLNSSIDNKANDNKEEVNKILDDLNYNVAESKYYECIENNEKKNQESSYISNSSIILESNINNNNNENNTTSVILDSKLNKNSNDINNSYFNRHSEYSNNFQFNDPAKYFNNYNITQLLNNSDSNNISQFNHNNPNNSQNKNYTNSYKSNSNINQSTLNNIQINNNLNNNFGQNLIIPSMYLKSQSMNNGNKDYSKFNININQNTLKTMSYIFECFDFLKYKEERNNYSISEAIIRSYKDICEEKNTALYLTSYLAYLEDLIHISKKAFNKKDTNDNFLDLLKLIRKLSKSIFYIKYLINKKNSKFNN